MRESFSDIISASISVKQQLLQQSVFTERMEQVTQLIVQAFRDGHRLYFCGNGGSAADAQHLAAEFSGAFYNRSRAALPAEALHTNSSYLTAVANDFGYDAVYARLVEGIMQPGDVLVGMSTSGNSKNILLAFEAARKKQVITVGMTGHTGGGMAHLSDYLFNVPSDDTPRIQECHMLIGHAICQLAEQTLFGQKEKP